MSPLARVGDRLIGLYQRATAHRAPTCRFDPSCSSYAREALASHGALRGGWMSVWRILRCNPWGGQGYDPVPDPKHSSECMNMHGDGRRRRSPAAS